MSYSDEYEGYNEFDDVNEIPASELGATFGGLTSGGSAIHPSGPGGISLEGSIGDDREALRQRDRARDREEREREMDRGMTDRERERTVRRRSSKGESNHSSPRHFLFAFLRIIRCSWRSVSAAAKAMGVSLCECSSFL